MSRNTQSTNNRRLLKSVECKLLAPKQSRRLTQKLCASDNTGSTADCTRHLLQLTNFPPYHDLLQEKSTRQQHGNAKKHKNSLQKRSVMSVGRATVPITPQMIRVAIKELQTRRVYVSSTLIASHLRHFYPIENNSDALKKELNKKLNCAVSVGLIARCGDDKYCIPTLREQASLNKTALTAFWDTYYRSEAPSTMEQLFTLAIPRERAYKKTTSVAPKRSYDSRNDNYEDLDEFIS